MMTKPALFIATSALILCSNALADSQIGTLSAASPTWDRPSATGAIITGTCGASANDSLNDNVPYELFYIRATTHTATLVIEVVSFEPTPLDFDPFIAVYCTSFDPAFPNDNLLSVDDDSAGYPNAFVFHPMTLDPDILYIAVVSSYSNNASSQYGDFVMNIGSKLIFSTQCLPDFSGDGVLNFFDISAFISLYTTLDPAADLNHDGSLNFFDVSAFLSAFTAGCP